MPEKTLKGKTAVVTGGAGGIGCAIAETLAASGASVVITGRNSDSLKKTADLLRKSTGSHVSSRVFDLVNAQEIEKGFGLILDEFGAVDILVNNAGAAVFKPAAELTIEEWENMISVNLTGAFLCSRAVLPNMLKQNSGIIINIVSVASVKEFEGCAGYGAAKAGLHMFTRVLREEVRGAGIRVTAVIPGATDTAIWNGAGDEFDRSKMIDPNVIGNIVRDICLVPDCAVVEDIIIRPTGGDL